MSSLNDTAAYTLVAGSITAGLAYLSSRISTRRASVADTLVTALRDAQRSRFLLDLAHRDHVALVHEPVQAWATALAAATAPVVEAIGADRSPDPPDPIPTPADIAKKYDEVVGWRVEEREARIRFAVVARARDVRAFADYHRLLSELAVHFERKKADPVPREFELGVDRLVDTVLAVRVPALLRPANRVARSVPGLRRLLVDADDIRVLVADYSNRRPRNLDDVPVRGAPVPSIDPPAPPSGDSRRGTSPGRPDQGGLT